MFGIISMPIFRKELFQTKARKQRLARASTTLSLEKSAVGERIVRVPAVKWGGEVNNFESIDAKTNHHLSSAINTFVNRFPKRKVNVLDWGCYTSPAVKELAQNSRLSVFGYSRDADPSMLLSKKVRYLQTGRKQLVKYFNKYKIKFDVIYSNGGLKNIPLPELVDYLISLKDCLRVGGKIFPDLIWSPYRHREIFSELQKAGFKLELNHNQLMCLTKIK